jgi:hypothetical protein
MIRFNKRKILIYFVIFAFVSIIFIIIDKPKKDTVDQVPILTTIVPEYKNLKLGISTKDDVIKNIGEPLYINRRVNQEILNYESNNPNFNNEILVKDNKVTFIREVVTQEDQKTISSITNKYGRPEKVLYGPRSGVGFYLYVYPEKGIAYIGHDKSGILLEIWYFVPTTYESFIINYARDYSETKSLIQ